ncbi:hypothetical protein LCGC14_0458020 [marine sediment metagenome]|uniref:DNA-directed DNA polymerase n=1 Tax=marine sediment metagenome TaxID=412755 RepID=A0A0F9SLA0_9ZZZZ
MIERWQDTILQAHLLGYQPKSLKALTTIFLGVDLDKTFVSERKQVRYEERADEVLEGCARDAWATQALHQLFYPEIERRGLLDLYRKELRVTRVLMDMQRAGMPLSQERVAIAEADAIRKMGRLEVELAELGIEDPGDKTEIASKFWKGKARKKTTKTGLSTKAEHLREFATAEQKPWVDKKIEWSQVDHFLSTYLSAWRGEDMLYPSLNQTGTMTWRFSCSDPNLQNVPKSIGTPLYQMFVAPEGYTWISADYSQLELRMLAVLSGDANLLGVFERGEDLHALTISRIEWLRDLARGTEHEADFARRVAKIVNFGIPYKVSPKGLVENVTKEQTKMPQLPPKPLSFVLARELIEGFYNDYPDVLQWQENQIAFGSEHGYVETQLGRPLYVPLLTVSDERLHSAGTRQAVCYPVQGGGAEIVKDGMLRCPKFLRMQVHDELLYLARNQDVEEYKRHLAAELPDNGYSIPFPVDIKVGRTWGAIKSIPDTLFEDGE